jgi:hypothetical protein
LICAIGAFTQAPRHSTSTHEKLAVRGDVQLLADPLVAKLDQLVGAAQHTGVVPQSCTWNLPTGSRLNMV